jgi:hypothetical protein
MSAARSSIRRKREASAEQARRGLMMLHPNGGSNMIAIKLNHYLRIPRAVRDCLLRFAAQALVSASLAAQPAAGTAPLHMELEREIALALSACPLSVAGTAAECRMLIGGATQQYRATDQE